MHRFIDPAYWFSLAVNDLAKTSLIILWVILAISAAAAIYFELLRRKNKDNFYKKTIKSLFNLALTNFILCALLLFFCYERIPLLSMRFWFLFWLILNITWSIKIYHRWQNIDKRKVLAEQEEIKKKYLPRKHGK